MTLGSDNVFPKIKVSEGTAWATPASGFGVLYEKTDGLLYFKNDAGTEYDLTATGGAGGGSVTVYDEGVNKGTASIVNLIGANVSGTVTSGTAVITVGLTGGTAYTRSAGNYTTSGTTFGTVDAANMSGTVVLTTSQRLFAGFTGAVSSGATNGQVYLTWFVNGSNVGDASLGVLALRHTTAGYYMNASTTYLTDVLAAGTHTVALGWCVPSGTATMLGTAGQPNPRFYVFPV